MVWERQKGDIIYLNNIIFVRFNPLFAPKDFHIAASNWGKVGLVGKKVNHFNERGWDKWTDHCELKITSDNLKKKEKIIITVSF